MITSKNKKLCFIIFCLAFVLSICGSAAAAPTNSTHNSTIQLNTITSDTTSDQTNKTNETSPDPQIYNNGQPVARGGFGAGHVFLTLAAAINAAQAGDTIMLENSTTPFTPTNGGFVISQNLNFNVFNNGTAYITGVDTSTTGHIFTIDSGVTVNISNIVFEDAQNSAILNNGTLNLTNCNFTDNTAQSNSTTNGYGGAINNNGALIVNNCNFTGNSITYGFGGAIYNKGTLTVNNSNFSSNNAGASGGAISNAGGIVTDNNCTFTSNIANYGGAIDIDLGSTFGTLTVNNSTFTSNTGTIFGGAIYDFEGILTENNNIFTNNNGGTGGGAIYSYDTGTSTQPASIFNTTFTDNVAGNGSAIDNNGGYLNVTSCNFNGNKADTGSGYGGAVYNDGTTSVDLCRIIDNTAQLGGGSAIYRKSGTLDANTNWWGSNNPNFSSLIGGTTSPNNWLILNIASPSTILNGAESTVTADLTHDQSGIYYDPANGHVPDGIPVTFTSILGTPLTKNLSTLNGEVIYTYTAGNIPGDASVTVTVDSISLYTLFIIVRQNVYVSPSGSDLVGDGSQTSPFKTIAHGLANVNDGGTVNIASGIYYENNIQINTDMNINGVNQGNTIINGMDDSPAIFEIVSPGTQVTISNLTLTNGNGGDGGGIYNYGGILIVNNCTFTSNTATNGGVIYNDGTLTVNQSTFTGNTATNGGAIKNQGNLNLNNSNFTSNTATDGGAFDNNGNSIFNNITFVGNNASNIGGAIYNDNVLTVNNSFFTGNNATKGGAIYNDVGLTVK